VTREHWVEIDRAGDPGGDHAILVRDGDTYAVIAGDGPRLTRTRRYTGDGAREAATAAFSWAAKDIGGAS